MRSLPPHVCPAPARTRAEQLCKIRTASCSISATCSSVATVYRGPRPSGRLRLQRCRQVLGRVLGPSSTSCCRRREKSTGEENGAASHERSKMSARELLGVAVFEGKLSFVSKGLRERRSISIENNAGLPCCRALTRSPHTVGGGCGAYFRRWMKSFDHIFSFSKTTPTRRCSYLFLVVPEVALPPTQAGR